MIEIISIYIYLFLGLQFAPKGLDYVTFIHSFLFVSFLSSY